VGYDKCVTQTVQIADQFRRRARALSYYKGVGTFYVENFGCRATQADGAAIDRQLRDIGLQRAASSISAQVVVLNTCTVTAAADQDARAAIRRLRRANPTCRILVTGCYAQRAPEEIAALPGVDCVIGNSHKSQLAEILQSKERRRGRDLEVDSETAAGHDRSMPFVPLAALAGGGARERAGDRRLAADAQASIYISDIFAHTELLAAPVFDGTQERTRPNLKVQDGCDNRCSFCVIPYVRGQSRSLPLQEVLAEVNALIAAGYREVVISGINLGRWGRDLSDASQFEELVRTILDRTDLQKLRISSVEPMDWSDELVSLVATSPRIAKHVHVPMQSGSDTVLRRMHRKYRPWHYRGQIEKIHRAMPDAAVGADVMVGFPGETDLEFEETRRMVDELPFTYLHVFTYSARPGTAATSMGSHVPVEIARERNRILRDLAASKKSKFMQSFVGKSVEAITLSTGGHGQDDNGAAPYTDALTDNYLKLRLSGSHAANRWITAAVEEVSGGELVGRQAHPTTDRQATLSNGEVVCSGNF
jgi:threonylcarbamoyladenosine tRNA methylthiotransferase MtaB